MKHTPGPWTVHNPTKTDHRLLVLHPDGERVIAHCNVGYVSGHDAISRQEINANARLIAAAPELLAALENILWSVNVRIDDPRVKHFDAARAAVAQATS